MARADTPSPKPSASPTATATASPEPSTKDRAKGDRKHRALQTRALHGEATVGGKKRHRVVQFQRGTVDQVSSTSITVTSADGFRATYRVDAKTKVRKDKQPATIADVKTADRVRVVATQDGSTTTATSIRDRGPRR
jgi:hypothetical protein